MPAGTCKVWLDDEVRLVLSPCGQQQGFSMRRKPDESLAGCLKRLTATLQKKAGKGAIVTASLVAPGGEPVPECTLNRDAWQHGGSLRVSHDDGATEWAVIRDQPVVDSLSLPELAVAGMPLFATADLRFASSASWVWRKTLADAEASVTLRSAEASVVGGRCTTCYTPTPADAGWTLSVAITPGGTATPAEPSSASCAHPVLTVEPRAFAPMEARQAQLRSSPPARGLRVVSYNVLWGLSTESVLRKGGWSVDLMRSGGTAPSHPSAPGCASSALQRDLHHVAAASQLPVPLESAAYRQLLLGKELLGYEADVVCLQELTEGVFRAALQPLMAERGLVAEYAAGAAGATHELATFWRAARLSRVASAVWHIGRLLEAPSGAALAADLGRSSPSLRAFVREQPHVAHAMLLRHGASGRHVAVVNTHLIMAGVAANVRTLQASLVLGALVAWAHGEAGAGTTPCGLVLCGDLNTYTESEGAIGLLTGSGVRGTSYEWVAGRNLGKRERRRERGGCAASVGRGGGACPNAALDGSPLCFEHRCGGCGEAKREFQPRCARCPPAPTPAPPDGPFFAADLACPHRGGLCSAYEQATGRRALMTLRFRPSTGEPTPGAWVECRDHILCSRDMRVVAALPPPETESLRGMPSLAWPSDHVALVADLEWSEEAVAEAAEEEAAAEEAPAEEQEAAPARKQGGGQAAAVPAPKRLKSEPAAAGSRDTTARPPRAQRSWGETSLRSSLP